MPTSFSLEIFKSCFYNYLTEAEKINDSVSYVFFGIIEYIISKDDTPLEQLLEDQSTRSFDTAQMQKKYLKKRDQLLVQVNQFLNLSDLMQSQQVILFLFDELFVKSDFKSEFIEELVLLIDFVEEELNTYQISKTDSLYLELTKTSNEAKELNKELFQLFGAGDSKQVADQTDTIVEVAFKLTHSVFYQAHLLSTIKLKQIN
ncbi:MAG: hypothetical protein KC646_11140 [Candidatus Cloacimonetes bacterium]|nr:hypothetical protein [Candidatus Cloacimonadota bacterium]